MSIIERLTTHDVHKTKKTGKLKFLLGTAIILILCILIAGAVYVNDYYRAGEQAKLALQSDPSVNVTMPDNELVIFEPVEQSASVQQPTESRGLIFYPGGKVEFTAYAPLLHQLAEEGWTCILVKMPFNLAVFDMDAADDIPEHFPRIDSWYLGGHSLGGSMAASFAADENDFGQYDGLVLLGSYSTANLSKSGLEVYSIYGSEDLVLNREKYKKYFSNLPTDTKELVIDGGCHAYFGDYGPQDGDGIPTITAEEQITATVDFLMNP